jgi:hypothetical protein
LGQSFEIYREAISFNQEALTGGTVCVVVVPMADISKIDILKTSVFCGCMTRKKSAQRGRWNISHFIIRVEPGEMNRGISSKFLSNPLAKLFDLAWSIIATWDHKVRKLKVNPEFFRTLTGL